MRPAEFTPEEIIQAGQELQAAGRNITGFALRQKVGGGNPSRLKQVWDEHQAGQTATHSEPVAELPVEVADEVAHVSKQLTDRLAALAVELNDKAVKAADRRVAEVVRSAGEQREQAERELADAAQTVDDLETKLDEAGTENERLEKPTAAAPRNAKGWPSSANAWQQPSSTPTQQPSSTRRRWPIFAASSKTCKPSIKD